MIISDKLSKLRAASGLSQEELAEKMNVSRQSVSKWESGASIPNLDKIVELSKLYGVSIDYLLKDEIEELPGEVVVDTYEKRAVREVTMEEAEEYRYTIRRVAQRIALGVLLCIFSPAPMMVLLGMSEGSRIHMNEDMAAGIGVGILLIIVAAAVVLFIINGMKLSPYSYLDREEIQLSYGVAGVVEKEEKNFEPVFQINIAIGVALCIIAVVPLIVAGSINVPDEMLLYMTAILLITVSIGVYMIVHVSMEKGGYQRLLQAGEYTLEKKRDNKKYSAFTSVYWSVITVCYLIPSFWTNRWDKTWIIWPVAAILYSVVYVIMKTVAERK